jgi:YidC/Oxa1 family membrane protein insertase
MQQWARFAILGAMFVTAYLLILAWQKDYGHAPPINQRLQLWFTHEVSADLPNAQATAASTDMPQANMRRNKLQKQASVNQQLISVQTDLYHLWINPKGGDIVRIELLSMMKAKTVTSLLSCLKVMQNVLMCSIWFNWFNGPDSSQVVQV